MKSQNRNLVYVITAIVAFVALVAALYVQVIDAAKLAVAIKDAASVATLFLAAFSSTLAKRHLSPDPE